MRAPVLVAVLGPASWLALVAAALLDPGHDLLADYVSWLSHGPYWWLAGLGVAGLALAAGLDARRLHVVMGHGVRRRAAVTFLACSTLLAAATVALPSRGFNEPAWRTATHVGLAVGAYTGILGAALLVAVLQRRHHMAGPPMKAWAGVVVAGFLVLGAASAQATLLDPGTDLRGLAQLVAAAAATGWLAAASRLQQAAPPGPGAAT